ncbi:MAG: hypothetical protein BroJett009_08840 [Armatimonadota bacterium]|nr:MAG: hypothetical protein BroJett009_08840 [Armatimonadota bacterium]
MVSSETPLDAARPRASSSEDSIPVTDAENWNAAERSDSNNLSSGVAGDSIEVGELDAGAETPAFLESEPQPPSSSTETTHIQRDITEQNATR